MKAQQSYILFTEAQELMDNEGYTQEDALNIAITNHPEIPVVETDDLPNKFQQWLDTGSLR